MPTSLPSFTTGTRRMPRDSISLPMSSAVASSPRVASSAAMTSRAVLPWALENRSASSPECLIQKHHDGPSGRPQPYAHPTAPRLPAAVMHSEEEP